MPGTEGQPVALSQFEGEAHHVAGDAIDRVDEGVDPDRGSDNDLAAIGQIEAAIRLRLADAEQTLAVGVLAGQQGGTGARSGMRFAVGQLRDATGAAAGAALVEQRDLRRQRRVEDAGIRGDDETAADAVGEVEGDLVLFHVRETPRQARQSGRRTRGERRQTDLGAVAGRRRSRQRGNRRAAREAAQSSSIRMTS